MMKDSPHRFAARLRPALMPAAFRLRLAASLAACLLLVSSLSGCAFLRVVLEPLPPPPTLPAEPSEPARQPGFTVSTIPSGATPSPKAASPAPSSAPATAAPTTVARPAPSGAATGPAARPSGTAATGGTGAADAFESRVSALILDGLEDASREIVLDSALAEVRIPASMADATIERVFDLFQALYYVHPEFYFLSGQANASYTVQHGTSSTLASLTLKPGFIESAAGQSTAAIRQRQARLVQKAAALAATARAAGSDPVKQLLAVHDDLVHLIRYDDAALKNQDLNRERSNAASGLLDGLALCQGYAASFQLVAQQLGFEVLMPTGTAEGISHAWNLVRIGQAYHHVDITYDDPTPDGGGSAPVDHVHFLRSDARMRETHAWTAANFPAAKDDAAAYYRLGGLVSAGRSDLQKRINAFVASLPDTLSEPSQFEVLYTGSDLPSLNDLERMLTAALDKAGYDGRITYRRRVDKQVVLIELLPG